MKTMIPILAALRQKPLLRFSRKTANPAPGAAAQPRDLRSEIALAMGQSVSVAQSMPMPLVEQEPFRIQLSEHGAEQARQASLKLMNILRAPANDGVGLGRAAE